MPNIDTLQHIMELIRQIVFPGFFDGAQMNAQLRRDMLLALLKEQIAYGLVFSTAESIDDEAEHASEKALRFMDELPRIKELLDSDVDAMMHNDPAVTTRAEVIFSYPTVKAMLHYRVAHALLQLEVPVLPRILTELAHSVTGIDIHPGATIGDHFCIDHGTGVVIGETCIIGSHCMLYQGVTLGARNFQYDAQGTPVNVPRHPILQDHVTVYSNSSILGRVTIGHDTIVGGNIWLTHDVPPHSKLFVKVKEYESITEN